MKIIKRILLGILLLIMIPVTFIIVSLLFTYIPVKESAQPGPKTELIYLHSNGIHVDMILRKENMHSSLLSGLEHSADEQYFSFGWGDKNFYLNTAKWSDLTIKNLFSALFLNTSSLVHLDRFKNEQDEWIRVPVTKEQLDKVNTYIESTFRLDVSQAKILLEGRGYFANDDFYEAEGSYSAMRSCNTWVNSCFKTSGMKACLWTPFDFGVLRKYK